VLAGLVLLLDGAELPRREHRRLAAPHRPSVLAGLVPLRNGVELPQREHHRLAVLLRVHPELPAAVPRCSSAWSCCGTGSSCPSASTTGWRSCCGPSVLAGLVLMLFIAFFLLKDGPRIWAWVIRGLRPEPRRRVGLAGEAAWRTLTAYVRGTTLVAAIHALFIGLALWLLGVPLLVPFIVLVFLAAFVPIIGILVVGALAHRVGFSALFVCLSVFDIIAAIVAIALLRDFGNVVAPQNQLMEHTS